jgi:hypothetical protein
VAAVSRSEARLLAIAAAVAVLVTAVGVGVRAFGHTMGTKTSPFVITWLPRADVSWTVAAIAALGLLVAVGPLLLDGPRAPYVLGLMALALGAGLTLNAARNGTYGWDAVFDLGPGGSFEAKNEYLPALPALSYGDRFFLDRFAELVPALPINAGGHPPGLLLFVHWTGLTTAGRFAALCIAATVLTAPLTYALARGCGLAERHARLAGLLAAGAPSLLLFGMTSADAVFACVGTAAAALLVRRSWWWRGAGALVLAAGAFSAWSLPAVGVFAALVTWRRDGWRQALALAVACAVPFLALNAVLAAATGYDPIGTLHATSDLYDRSLARIRPYAYWWIGSPVAWAVMLGLPTAGAWLVATRRTDRVAVALAVVVVVAALAGFTKAEVERIWLFLVPPACVAAATVLPAGRLRGVLLALGVQALAVQLLFQTIW